MIRIPEELNLVQSFRCSKFTEPRGVELRKIFIKLTFGAVTGADRINAISLLLWVACGYRRTSISGTTFSGKKCLSRTIFHAI
jgi:hypothetical protein